MSKKFNDGGSAFPTLGDEFMRCPDGSMQPKSSYGMQGAPGMSLRDYFAGQALPAIISKVPLLEQNGQGYGEIVDTKQAKEVAELVATGAYIYADAMIAAMAKGPM